MLDWPRFSPWFIHKTRSLDAMEHERAVTAAYLAELVGLNPELVRRYARQLREMLSGEETASGQ